MGQLLLTDVLGTGSKQHGTSRPVGAVETIHQTSLTDLTPDPDAPGGVIYGDEIDVGYCHRIHRLAQPDVTVSRLEFKPVQKGKAIKPGTLLFVTEFPHRSMWAAWAPFKRSRKDAVPGMDDVASKQDLLDVMAKTKQDIFESRTGVLTAAIEETQFGSYFAPSQTKSRDTLKHVFGCYTPADGQTLTRDALAQSLFDSDYVRKQVRLFKSGLPLGPEKTVTVPEPLKEDIESLFWLSILQALAGAGDKSATYHGKPVLYFARDLCEQHLIRATRKELNRATPMQQGYGALETDEEARRRMNIYLAALNRI